MDFFSGMIMAFLALVNSALTNAPDALVALASTQPSVVAAADPVSVPSPAVTEVTEPPPSVVATSPTIPDGRTGFSINGKLTLVETGFNAVVVMGDNGEAEYVSARIGDEKIGELTIDGGALQPIVEQLVGGLASNPWVALHNLPVVIQVGPLRAEMVVSAQGQEQESTTPAPVALGP